MTLPGLPKRPNASQAPQTARDGSDAAAPGAAAPGAAAPESGALACAALVLAVLALAGLLAWSIGPVLVWLKPSGGLLALAWLAAALGFGGWVRRALFPGLERGSMHRGPLTAALGVSALLAIDSLLATAGAFRAGLHWPAIGVLVVGVALFVHAAWVRVKVGAGVGVGVGVDVGGGVDGGAGSRARARARTIAMWLALPSLAALAAAATVPTGLLWPSEFGGYDALSYHLQVPREWLLAGSAAPLPHNVYSALPSFMETATLHLLAAAQWEDARNVAAAAQMLHAMLTAIAAWLIGCVAASCVAASCVAALERPTGDSAERGPAIARAVAWCFALGVPWVIVVGSLAYNEMGMLVGFAGALLAWQCGSAAQGSRWRIGAAVGLLLGAAVGCKLTAVGMAVAPAALWMAIAPCDAQLRTRRSRAVQWAAVGAVAALVCVVILLPWMWRNWAATGNPVFPFASGLFGTGWWTAEQAARFAGAHAAVGGAADRASALWNQGLAYGMGAPPDRFEPWVAQWSIAWWLAAAALAALVALAWKPRGGTGRIALASGAMLVAQLAFWVLATHMKSRFLVPCVVPMAIAVGAAAALVLQHARTRASTAVLATLLVAWCAHGVIMLWREPNVRLAFQSADAGGYDGVYLGGGPPDVAQRITSAREAVPFAWAANFMLPPKARLAAEGEAAVFWCEHTPDYATVWDGGPLARALKTHGDDPVGAIRALTDAGFTHLAINDGMFSVWERAGWLDPALTPGRVQSVTARLRPVRPFLGMGGGTLFELPLPASRQ